MTSDAGALLLGEVDRALIAVVPLYQKRPFLRTMSGVMYCRGRRSGD